MHLFYVFNLYINQLVRKALILSAFFVFAFLFSIASIAPSFALSPSPSVASPSFDLTCPKPSHTQKAHVKWVYDGDTLKLADKRKLRIIGIDTPEVAHKKGKKKRSEPYAGQATEALRELLTKNNYRIAIQEGTQNRDKYGRLLAHVFTSDDINVSEWLLRQGLATLLMIPPNDRYLECYRVAEKQAQKKGLNIWQLPQNKIRAASSLKSTYNGYVRLKGTVKRIKRRKNKISITLDHQIYITIKKPDLGLFKDLDSEHLKGKTIQVTGMLYRHGKKGYIRVRHPVYLDLD